MAARYCWSTFCRASARLHWLIARGEASREHHRARAVHRTVVAALAQSRSLDHHDGRLLHSGCAFTALVDLAGRDLCRCGAVVYDAVLRRRGVSAIASASGFAAPGRFVRPRALWNVVVRRTMGRAALRGRADSKTPDGAGPVLPFRAIDTRFASFHGISGVLR